MPSEAPPEPAEAPLDCPRCARLVDFRAASRRANPGWFNAPVPSFGAPDASLLIVGLAPGLRGANRTGRPFTGDHAGDFLYPALIDAGLALGPYRADPADGLTLVRTMITNAVRCVPPENKPTPEEIRTCRPFLAARVAALPRLKVIFALGRIAHESVVRTYGGRLAAYPFGHGAEHRIATYTLVDSYHSSRHNTATGRLTRPMLDAVLARAVALLD